MFEPIARAASSIGILLLPSEEERAKKVSAVLEAWCSSSDFETMLAEAQKSKSSISMALGRESLAQYSGSASFVVGLPIDEVISAFSALVRADLRARESRSIVRLDEIFLWQSAFKKLTLHDLTLLILSAFASKNVISTFDRLLAIKEEPGTLNKIENDLLSTDLSVQFTSGMRHFALSNFEAAETAYSLAIEKDPQSPSVYLAMALLCIITGQFEEANELIHKAEHKSESSLLVSIKHLIKLLLKEETPEFWADDPISAAVTSFFLLQDRQYDQLLDFSKIHLQNFPHDLIMQFLAIEAIFAPVRDEVFDDPPLPGGPNAELSLKLDELRIRTKTLADMADTMDLPNLKSRALTNLSAVALMQRDFHAATKSAEAALLLTPSNAEAKINLATTMIATGDLPKAFRALNAMLGEYKQAGLRLAAEAHYHACAFESAIDVWKRIMSDEKDRLWRLRYLCRMLEVYRLLREGDKAQNCVDEMLNQFQHEPETLVALGYELWQMNRHDDAINALRRAKDLAAPHLKQWIAWELGRVLFDADKPLAATDEYVSVADKQIDSVQAREFCVALFRAGLLPAASERAKAIREVIGEVVPGITEIETDFLVRENRLAEAKLLLQSLSRKRPLSVLNRMAIARICATLDEEEEARKELEAMRALDLSPEMRDDVDRFCADLDIVIALKAKHG